MKSVVVDEALDDDDDEEEVRSSLTKPSVFLSIGLPRRTRCFQRSVLCIPKRNLVLVSVTC